MIKNVFSPVELLCECVGCFLLVPSDLPCAPSNLPPMPSAKEAALHGPLHHWGSSALRLLFGSCQSGGNWQKERMVRIHILPSLSLPPTFSALAVTFYQRSWLLMSNPRSSCHILPGFQGPPPPQPSILLLILGCFTTPSGISTATGTSANNPLMRLSPMILSRVPSVSCNDHDQHWASMTFLAFVSIHQAVHSLTKESKLEKNRPTTGRTTLHNSWNNEGIAAKKIKESCFTVYITNRGSRKGMLWKVGMFAMFRIRDNHGLLPVEGTWVIHNRLEHAHATILPFLMKLKNLASSGN